MAFQINRKKIAKNILTLYVRQAITMFISFFAVRVTLEQLGVEDYGLNNLVGSIVAMFSFINGSMGTAVQRFYSFEIGRENKDRLKRIFGVGLYLHFIVATITLVISEFFALFLLGKMNIPPDRMTAAHVVFQTGVATLVLGVVSVPYSAMLRAREMFSQTALVEIVQAFLRLGVLYLLVILPFDKLVALSLLNFGVSFGGILAFVVMARQFEETHSGPIRDQNLMKEMLKFVSLLILTVLTQLLNTQGIVMLINLFFGLTINAAYAVAAQVQHAINAFVVNFKSSMVPQIVAAYGAGDLKSMHRLIDFGTKVTFLMMLMITLPIIFFTRMILTLWLNNPPMYAAELVMLTLIAINVSSFTYFHYQGVHASGKIVQQQAWMSGLYLLSIAFVFVLFKLGFSFYAAVIVNIVVGVLQVWINLFYARKYIEYSVLNFTKTIVLPVILVSVFAVGCFYVCSVVANTDCARFVLVMVADIVFLPLISLWVLLNRDERNQVFGFMKKKCVN